jgi:hypothetical protein
MHTLLHRNLGDVPKRPVCKRSLPAEIFRLSRQRLGHRHIPQRFTGLDQRVSSENQRQAIFAHIYRGSLSV